MAGVRTPAVKPAPKSRWRTKPHRRRKRLSKAPKPKPDDPAQSARFIEAAKALEVDETGEAFDKAFKSIVPEKRTPTQSDGRPK